MNSSLEAVSPLGLHLTFAAGKGIAALRGRRLGAVEVERLDLEIPRLVFPFDISEGIARFQSRRCIVRAASFSLSEEALSNEVARLFPAADLRLRVREGYLSLSGRFVWHASSAVELTARLYLDVAYGRIVLALLDDVRLYTLSPVPVPFITRALLSGVLGVIEPGALLAGSRGAASRHSLRLLGAAAAEVDPLRMLVAAYLPRLGWKIPDVREVRLEEVKLSGGKLSLSYSAHDTVVRPFRPSLAVLQAREAQKLFSGAEEALLGGRLDEALSRFRREVERVGHHPLLDLRIGEILAADASRASQAQSHLIAALGRHPDGTHAPRLRALLAQVYLREGQAEEALLQLEALADAAEVGGDPEEALWAGLFLARSVKSADLSRIIARLERLAQHQGARPLLEALCELYERAERYEDLALLWREMSAAEEDPLLAAELRARLGDLYLLRLKDAKRAKTQYERALSREPRCGAAWRGLAEILLGEGDTRAALGALDEALQLAPDDHSRAEIHLRVGTIWERILEDPESAALRYGEALALSPGSPSALSHMAALHARRGRFSRAAACYEELARSRSLDTAARTRALLSLATLLEESLGDPDEAYACARRALELSPQNQEARDMRERLGRTRRSQPEAPEETRPAEAPRRGEQGDKEERTLKTASLFARPITMPAKETPAPSEAPQPPSPAPAPQDALTPPNPAPTAPLPLPKDPLDDSTLDALADLALSDSEASPEGFAPTPERRGEHFVTEALRDGREEREKKTFPSHSSLLSPHSSLSEGVAERKEAQGGQSAAQRDPLQDTSSLLLPPPASPLAPARENSSVVPLDDQESLARAMREAQAEGRPSAALYYGALLSFLDPDREQKEVYAPPSSGQKPHPGALLPPRDLFLALAPALGPLVSALSPEVEPGPPEVAQELFSLASALDAPPFMLRWVAGDDIRVVLGEPPAIEIGVEGDHPSAERRFRLARALAQIRLSAPLAQKLSPQELEEVVFLMAAACDPVTVVADEGALSEGMRAQVQALLEQTPAARRQESLPAVSLLLDAYGVCDFAEFRRGILATCDREALLSAKDLTAALKILAKEAGQEPAEALRHGPCRDLALFAFQERAMGDGQ